MRARRAVRRTSADPRRRARCDGSRVPARAAASRLLASLAAAIARRPRASTRRRRSAQRFARDVWRAPLVLDVAMRWRAPSRSNASRLVAGARASGVGASSIDTQRSGRDASAVVAAPAGGRMWIARPGGAVARASRRRSSRRRCRARAVADASSDAPAERIAFERHCAGGRRRRSAARVLAARSCQQRARLLRAPRRARAARARSSRASTRRRSPRRSGPGCAARAARRRRPRSAPNSSRRPSAPRRRAPVRSRRSRGTACARRTPRP